MLEAGGAYVPVDTAHPPERVAAMLAAAGARVLITDRDVAGPVARLGLAVVAPCGPSRAGRDAGEQALSEFGDAALAPEHLAYAIYTSGSTGVPKGVAMSHRGLARLIRWQVEDGPPGLSTLQFTPIGFDVTFQEVFSTLCTGGTLHLVSDALRRDPERLLAVLDERSVERLFLPYVALQQLAKASARTGLVPRALRHVVTAGERLIVTEAIAAFFGALPNCRLDNHYGPTEAHLVTSYSLGGAVSEWPSLPPIGSAVGGVLLYNLDPGGEPVAAGETGELYVGGTGLARGYLGAPGSTAERFLPDPFAASPGARMYKTGDLVRIGRDGTVDFIGRADDQIKVRGFRVEPAEIALALTAHPRVRQAAAGLRSVAEDVDALVGYVVPDGPQPSVSELSRHLRARLPEYMVPSRYVFLTALPTTTNGKLDLRALQAVELDPPAEAPPAGAALAQIVRAIWERVLGHDEFEPEDDFFDVGGDSLLATWVVTELGLALGREIQLSVLLGDSTVAGIARALEAMQLRPTAAARTSEIISLNAGSSARALYVVHPLGGELLAYRELARALRSRLRVLGLRWQSAGPTGALSLSLPEMAATHLVQLRALQPHGPYLLAGWSFGGVLAYELAQQIAAAGERVEFLGLFDANPVLDPTTGLATRESPLFERLSAILDADGDLSHLLADPQLASLLGSTVPAGITATHLRKNLHITRASIGAAMLYEAAPYAGPVDLFQPDDVDPARKAALERALRGLVRGPLHIHPVPGDHYGMLRAPAVARTALALDDALAVLARR